MNNAFGHIIKECIPEQKNKLLLLYDDTTDFFLPLLTKAAKNNNKILKSYKLPIGTKHGEEPNKDATNNMLKAEAIICLTKYSLAHTLARKKTEEQGIVFLSMPDYNEKMIENAALFADYKKLFPNVNAFSKMLTNGKNVIITTELGTNLTLNINGRQSNCCPGFTNEDFLLGSPPDIEANIAPIENRTNGSIIVDGSITDNRIGLLKETVVLEIKNGFVNKISCENKQIEKEIKKIFEEVNSPYAYIVGELGIGFNDKASLCGNMLIDEGVKGCIHFGIGSNWTIGGKNKVSFHLDFVIKDATMLIDEKTAIKKGIIAYG